MEHSNTIIILTFRENGDTEVLSLYNRRMKYYIKSTHHSLSSNSQYKTYPKTLNSYL